jgi:mono/diheme cytochrome c family protein
LKQKRIAALVVAAAVVVVGGTLAARTFSTERSSVADDKVALADVKGQDPGAIARGKYVMAASDCAACHTAGQGSFAGGYRFNTAFGTLQSSNITPDRQTGIGAMTERDFFNAVRHGRGSKGLLYPAMPYTAYTKLTDQDMHDLWAYLATVRPVRNKVDEAALMKFPFNIRLAMAGWDMLFFDNKPFAPGAALTDEQKRGQYLVDGAEHCSVCHTPRNFLGAEKGGHYLAGSNLGDSYAPDITPNPETGIGTLGAAQLAAYLKTGANDHALASGPMAEAVENSLQFLHDDDIRAIVSYLGTVPASSGKAGAPPSIAAGELATQAQAYEVNCSACHGLKGEGIKGMIPAFAGNRAILAEDATNLIHAMLRGARAVHTDARPTAAGMPAFDWKMNDTQIAGVLNYVRNTWGNHAPLITAEAVGKLRQSAKEEQSAAVTAADRGKPQTISQ